VGAAIILLSLPLDLFFQQIVSYPSISVIDSSANATISRAIRYNPDPETQWRGNDEAMPPDTQMDSILYAFWVCFLAMFLPLNNANSFVVGQNNVSYDAPDGLEAHCLRASALTSIRIPTRHTIVWTSRACS
jgi:hypothetical protein